MSIHATFLSSPTARLSLKRGLAGQAFCHADVDPDLPRLLRDLLGMSSNRKALVRTARRIARRPGVAAVRLSQGGGLSVLVRTVCNVDTTVDSVGAFSETAILYTRVSARRGRSGMEGSLWRASFCRHALERLVERSDVPLDRPLLSALDAEASAILKGLQDERMIEHDGNQFLQGSRDGLWAGSVDAIRGEDGLLTDGRTIPVFSARTFLGPDQVKPMVWLRWKSQGMAVPRSVRR